MERIKVAVVLSTVKTNFGDVDTKVEFVTRDILEAKDWVFDKNKKATDRTYYTKNKIIKEVRM